MRVLIIIPAYNEEENIEKVVNNLVENYNYYDYLIVNDGSTDATEQICKKNGYCYVTMTANLGIGGGVQAGYEYARRYDYDIAVQLDGDGQHDPAYIENMIEEILNTGCDMVVGSRFITNEGFRTSKGRRAGIYILNRIIWLCCKIHITDCTSGFRACSKELIHFFASNYAYDYPEPEAIVKAGLNGYKVKEIPVVMKERGGGQSSITIGRSVYYMVKVTLSIVLCRLQEQEKRNRRDG